MQSRMDKYNTEHSEVRSRTERNRDLYETVKNSNLKDFDVNSNVQVIDDNQGVIDVGHIRQILDTRYRDDAPKRKSIVIPEYEDEEPIEEEVMDTKEYDINAILSKAKEGKTVDYSKARLQFLRDAQYDILNNLDLELKKIEEPTEKRRNTEAEENLMNLINTITHIEAINKEKYSKEVSGALDLLGLGDDDSSTVETELKKEIEQTEQTEVDDETSEVELVEEVKEPEKDKDSHIEETLSKLDINLNSYDDFKDISKSDKSSIVIKLVVFVLIAALIIGAIFILNNILNLGLF